MLLTHAQQRNDDVQRTYHLQQRRIHHHAKASNPNIIKSNPAREAATQAPVCVSTVISPIRIKVDPDKPAPIEWLQDGVLCIIFATLDAKTLLVSIPQVCKLWRALCQDVENVHLDFRWWGGEDEYGNLVARGVPVEVLAGWGQTPFMLSSGGDGGGSSSGCVEAAGSWKTGLCELFQRTISVTMDGQHVEDTHLLVLVEMCPGITHVNFSDSTNLTDAAVLALANKCPGITKADFSWCEQLTDAAVIALADKCPARFGGCCKLTDAALFAMINGCPQINYNSFPWGVDTDLVSDAAVVALADKCPGITNTNFRCCGKLKDAAVIALAEKCHGITHVDFAGCKNLTDAAVVALADDCPGITHAIFGCFRSTLTDAAVLALADKCPRSGGCC